MKYLIYIVIILVVIIYIQYYNKFKSDYNIIQTNLDTIDLSVLHEKYPIVIYEQIYEPHQLLTTLFKYTFVKSETKTIDDTNKRRNDAKYLILWGYEDDLLVDITSPSDNNYITIKLKPNQVLILPYQWHFNTNKNLQSIWLHDPISLLQKYLGRG
jgi:hypothetical protein